MAQKIQTLFIDDIDDIDGGEDDEGTVRFSLDGTDYEIDLRAKHSDELRDRCSDVMGPAAPETPIFSVPLTPVTITRMVVIS